MEASMAERHRRLPELRDDRPISADEIRDVLADEGYSAGERKTWLKSVLTELQQGPQEASTPERRRLIDEVKSIIAAYQDGKPVADDVL
jgi:hypothetical protein